MYKEYTDGTNISYAARGALFARQEEALSVIVSLFSYELLFVSS